ncbi:amino acid permease [Alcanivorax sp. IO_7]|nr:amino acid permease [Alcanivorax sp. IO_7]
MKMAPRSITLAPPPGTRQNPGSGKGRRATENGVGDNDGKLGLAQVTAIGIGGMIGGGIFAVLGLAIATAGHAVALTLAGGGVIALLTGLSYAHLGLAYRDDGGSFTYIEKAFASPPWPASPGGCWWPATSAPWRSTPAPSATTAPACSPA